MNEEHFILISLEDSKSKIIADVLNNKTCKKIISYLTQTKEASEKDLSDALKLPINTIEYNIKKLVEAGFVQKKQNFFWSKKGKKILMYELTNKFIVLSPKKSVSNKIKSIIPAFLFSVVGSFSIWVYEKINNSKISNNLISQITQDNSQVLWAKSESIMTQTTSLINPASSNWVYNPHLWLYFFIGSLIAIIIISVLNWRKL
ncbi:helix-turn-helix transcriptional regulator [Candidatus Woesearchaeota archaeon]|jgi:predicted transcriptional regulator|nr:helix-turn-helix transcriptional regulator [Candidatus Woesearchaeota archaeon]